MSNNDIKNKELVKEAKKYLKDRDGVELDYPKGIALMIEAANNGYVSAQYNLGIIYQGTIYTERNEEEALRWITMAAENGDVDAMKEVALLHENRKDFCEAVRWYKATNNKLENLLRLYNNSSLKI